MKQNLKGLRDTMGRYWKVALSLVFAVAVFLFWYFPYQCALNYQEQFQLFLFTSDYFVERLAVPGGFTDWVAEFLVQFYYLPLVGAIILAVIFLLLQRLTALLFRQLEVSDAWYELSFVPALCLWAYMGNEHVLLSLAVALLAAEGALLLFLWVDKHFEHVAPGLLLMFVGTPVFYWLFGGTLWVVVLFAVGYRLLCRRQWGRAPFVVVYAIAVCLFASLVTPYSLGRLFFGINYFRYPENIPAMQGVVMVVFALLPLVAKALPSLTDKRQMLTGVVTLVIVAVLGLFGAWLGFPKLTYRMINADYLVRTQQWDKIIAEAEKEPATTPMGVSIVNFALAQRGLLLDRLFEFYQNGAEGLFPSFTRDMTSPVPTSEIFFALGMVNDAERYAFEAQEAIPNYRKSGRLTKRIAQCEIVNGNYAVAAKYLRMLQQSLFYSKWATAQLRFIGNDAAVKADPLYGRLRDLRIKRHDYLFSDREMDQMLGMLLIDNRRYNNRMAYEYLIAYELLQRDLARFKQYYPLGQYFKFDHIPNTIQQVLIGEWAQSHKTLDGMPYSVDRMNVESTMQFLQTYMKDPSDRALQQPPLYNNAWRYLLQGRAEKKKKEKMKDIY